MAQTSDLDILEEILEQSGEEVPESILDLDEFLNHSPLFSVLDSEGRRRLAKQASFRALDPGDVLFKEGSSGDTFAIVKKGALVVEATTLDGVTKQLAVLGPGAVVGEVAVVMNKPRTATVTAQDDVELFEFSASDVAPLMEAYPDLRAKLTELVEARSDQTVQVFLGKE